MVRTPNSFKRQKPRFKEQPTVLVICEDSKSGKHYLEDARLHFRITVSVEITHCGKTDPLNIVKEALNRQGKFDHVFCVIDRDNHQNFDEALNLANSSNKIEIIASYPCFEFWLLIHFVGYNRKPYTVAGNHSAADLVIKDLRLHPGFENYDKGEDKNIFGLLLGNRFTEARRVAPRILADAFESGNMNPSSKLHELIDFFEKLSSPQIVDNIA
jgi:RloB-like protein